MTTPRGTVRVQRSGPRGWHLIAKDKFDPAVHVECDENGNPVGKPALEHPAETTIHLGKEPAGPEVAREIGSALANLQSSGGSALEARTVARGWFKVHRDGVLVEGSAAMRKEDAEAFNALSDEGKEAFVAPKAETEV